MTTFGKKLKAARKAKGLKQKDLAKKLKMNPSTISRLENDVHLPQERTLIAIEKILGRVG